MSSVTPIVRQQPVRGPEPDERGAGSDDAPKATGTALVPVARSEAPAQDDGRRQPRRSAAFLAQLIATQQQLPQTRILRRAEPLVAHAAYGAAARLARRAR